LYAEAKRAISKVRRAMMAGSWPNLAEAAKELEATEVAEVALEAEEDKPVDEDMEDNAFMKAIKSAQAQ
jgi:hypothetical protein